MRAVVEVASTTANSGALGGAIPPASAERCETSMTAAAAIKSIASHPSDVIEFNKIDSLLAARATLSMSLRR
jgi:hypothetical protein